MPSNTPLYINGFFLTQPHSGIGLVTEQVLLAMRKENAERPMTLLFQEGQVQDVEQIAQKFGMKVVLLKKLPTPSTLLQRFYWEAWQIPQFLRKQGAAVYFSTFPHPFLCFPGKGKSIYMMVHDVFPWKYAVYAKKWTRKVYNALMARTLKSSKIHILTVSQTAKNEIENMFHPVHKVEVIYNGVDHLKEVPLMGFSEIQLKWDLTRPYIFYMGGYDLRKNVSSLISSYKVLRRERKDVTLVLGGNILYSSALYTDIRDLAEGIPGIVHTGFLTKEEMKALYYYAEVVVHPSKDEGFNIPLGEALSEGTSVLASDIPIHRELWKDWVRLEDFTDIPRVGKVLSEMLEISSEKKKHTLPYTWSRVAQHILNLL